MNAMLAELVAHKGYANAIMLREIARSPAALADAELRGLLHHILLANRFWLLTLRGLPFDDEAESRVSSSFDELGQRYRRSHEDESAWLASATDADLSRVLEHPHIPGGSCARWQALMQVCLHTHGTSSTVREDAPASRWCDAADGLHPVARRASGTRVARRLS